MTENEEKRRQMIWKKMTQLRAQERSITSRGKNVKAKKKRTALFKTTHWLKNRLLAKLRDQLKITNTTNEVEAQSEPFPTVAIHIRNNFETFDKGDYMLIEHAVA